MLRHLTKIRQFRGQKFYGIDHHESAGLIVGDYMGNSIRIARGSFSRPAKITVIDTLDLNGIDLPVTFPHSVHWLDDESFLVTLAKQHRHSPKLQGSVLLVGLDGWKARRIDDVFRSHTFESFPVFAGPCGEFIGVSYAGLDAVLLFDESGKLYKAVGPRPSIDSHIRRELMLDSGSLVELSLKAPHAVVALNGTLFIADTGHGNIIRVDGVRASYLHDLGDDKFAWRPDVPSPPPFGQPTSLRITGELLIVCDFASGAIVELLNWMADRGTILGHRLFFSPNSRGPLVRLFGHKTPKRVHAFDFCRLADGWLLNDAHGRALWFLAAPVNAGRGDL